MKNYYKILEVNENASQEIINKIFKIHIKKNHPDLFDGEEKLLMEEKVKEINEAYEILSDEEKRKKYDDELKQEQTDTNDNKTLILLEENKYLKELLQKKEQLINDFLSNTNTEINNYENDIENFFNNENDINDNYDENNNFSTEYENKNYTFKELLLNYLNDNSIFIKKLFFSILLIIVGFIFIEKLTGINLLGELINIFLN